MTPAADWFEQVQRLFDVLRASVDEAPTEAHAEQCRWCPVCQVSAVVRGERPEVTAALADVLTATAGALQAFATAAGSPPAPTEATGEDDDGPPAAQRIDIA